MSYLLGWNDLSYDKDTMKRLWLSCEHWLDNFQRVKRRRIPYISADHCALCEKFTVLGANKDWTVSFCCNGCPVSAHSGENSCRKTPYEKVDAAHEKMFHTLMKFTDRDWKHLLKAVEDEYRFLVDLAYRYAEKRD